MQTIHMVLNVWIFLLAAAISCILWKWWSLPGSNRIAIAETSKMNLKTVLITGASSGIGLATAEAMVESGARVILACHTIESGNAVASEIWEKNPAAEIVVHQVDLSSIDSIVDFAIQIRKTESRLDVLINNAGVSVSWFFFSPKIRILTCDKLEVQMAVNYYAPVLLTMLLLDLLKASAPSRIINVACEEYKCGKIDLDNLNGDENYDSYEMYCNSKLALQLFTRELSSQIKDTGVTVNSIHPGITRSNLHRYGPNWSKFLFSIRMLLLGQNTRTAAQNLQYLASSKHLQDITGQYFIDNKPGFDFDINLAHSVQKDIWRVTANILSLKHWQKYVEKQLQEQRSGNLGMLSALKSPTYENTDIQVCMMPEQHVSHVSILPGEKLVKTNDFPEISGDKNSSKFGLYPVLHSQGSGMNFISGNKYGDGVDDRIKVLNLQSRIPQRRIGAIVNKVRRRHSEFSKDMLQDKSGDYNHDDGDQISKWKKSLSANDIPENKYFALICAEKQNKCEKTVKKHQSYLKPLDEPKLEVKNESRERKPRSSGGGLLKTKKEILWNKQCQQRHGSETPSKSISGSTSTNIGAHSCNQQLKKCIDGIELQSELRYRRRKANAGDDHLSDEDFKRVAPRARRSQKLKVVPITTPSIPDQDLSTQKENRLSSSEYVENVSGEESIFDSPNAGSYNDDVNLTTMNKRGGKIGWEMPSNINCKEIYACQNIGKGTRNRFKERKGINMIASSPLKGKQLPACKQCQPIREVTSSDGMGRKDPLPKNAFKLCHSLINAPSKRAAVSPYPCNIQKNMDTEHINPPMGRRCVIFGKGHDERIPMPASDGIGKRTMEVAADIVENDSYKNVSLDSTNLIDFEMVTHANTKHQKKQKTENLNLKSTHQTLDAAYKDPKLSAGVKMVNEIAHQTLKRDSFSRYNTNNHAMDASILHNSYSKQRKDKSCTMDGRSTSEYSVTNVTNPMTEPMNQKKKSYSNEKMDKSCNEFRRMLENLPQKECKTSPKSITLTVNYFTSDDTSPECIAMPALNNKPSRDSPSSKMLRTDKVNAKSSYQLQKMPEACYDLDCTSYTSTQITNISPKQSTGSKLKKKKKKKSDKKVFYPKNKNTKASHCTQSDHTTLSSNIDNSSNNYPYDLLKQDDLPVTKYLTNTSISQNGYEGNNSSNSKHQQYSDNYPPGMALHADDHRKEKSGPRRVVAYRRKQQASDGIASKTPNEEKPKICYQSEPFQLEMDSDERNESNLQYNLSYSVPHHHCCVQHSMITSSVPIVHYQNQDTYNGRSCNCSRDKEKSPRKLDQCSVLRLPESSCCPPGKKSCASDGREVKTTYTHLKLANIAQCKGKNQNTHMNISQKTSSQSSEIQSASVSPLTEITSDNTSNMLPNNVTANFFERSSPSRKVLDCNLPKHDQTEKEETSKSFPFEQNHIVQQISGNVRKESSHGSSVRMQNICDQKIPSSITIPKRNADSAPKMPKIQIQSGAESDADDQFLLLSKANQKIFPLPCCASQERQFKRLTDSSNPVRLKSNTEPEKVIANTIQSPNTKSDSDQLVIVSQVGTRRATEKKMKWKSDPCKIKEFKSVSKPNDSKLQHSVPMSFETHCVGNASELTKKGPSRSISKELADYFKPSDQQYSQSNQVNESPLSSCISPSILSAYIDKVTPKLIQSPGVNPKLIQSPGVGFQIDKTCSCPGVSNEESLSGFHDLHEPRSGGSIAISEIQKKDTLLARPFSSQRFPRQNLSCKKVVIFNRNHLKSK